MSEQSLRTKMVSTMVGWLGRNEASGTHKEIIDIYNTIQPLPRGYKLQYSDEWCAGTVSAAAQYNGLTDIIPPECSCGKQVELFQQLGRWVEGDWYTPKPGDVIYYDWADTGAADCIGWPDHVGIVENVANGTITVIEGNKGCAVARRTILVGSMYIRGYGIPDYAEKLKGETSMTVADAKQVIREKAGLAEATIEWLSNYRWGDDLLIKLAKAML